jgi:type I restriction enzyme, R subunit
LQQLDFEFVLFASSVVDYDYIMQLISKYTQRKPSKQKMTKEQLINMLSSSANLMEERDDITDYINSLEVGKGLDENEIKEGYEKFKDEKNAKELAAIAEKHGLKTEALKDFTDSIVSRMIFDGEKLNDLLAPLELSWKERTKEELALMEDLVPVLKKLAQGKEISGLKAYE